MPKSIDQRQFGFDRASQQKFERQAAEEQSKKNLSKSHTVSIGSVSKFLGGAELVQSSYTKKSTRHLNKEERNQLKAHKELSDATIIGLALKHLQKIGRALGFRSNERPDFVPDPLVKKSKSGDRIVNVQQCYRGIPVFQMSRVVVLDRTGAIKYVDGSSVSIPYDLEIRPLVALEDAMLAAARYVASPDDQTGPSASGPAPDASQEINLHTYKPRVLCRFPTTSQRAVIDKESFGEVIPANLVFFYTGSEVRLAWRMIISTENMMDQFVVIIEADAKTQDRKHPDVLFGISTASSMADAKGAVWTHNPEKNAETKRLMLNFTKPLGRDPIDPRVSLPSDFPHAWVEDGSDQANGNNVVVLPSPARSTLVDGIRMFKPDVEQGPEQRALNAFYYCNVMHDFFYVLGFDESMNLQDENATGNGSDGDALEVTIHDGHGSKLGVTLSSVDGKKTTMQLLVGASLPSEAPRHAALDAEVVFHEYTHAVTARRVGASSNNQPFTTRESLGLSEGWSDYFALTLLNHDFDLDLTTIMGWISDREETGLRSHRYDDNFTSNTGTPVGALHKLAERILLPPFTTEHTIGVIWCAILMKMDRELRTVLGDKKRGHRLGWQIVFNGLLELGGDPTFRQARDRIVERLGELELTEDEHSRVKETVEAAFAFFGL